MYAGLVQVLLQVVMVMCHFPQDYGTEILKRKNPERLMYLTYLKTSFTNEMLNPTWVLDSHDGQIKLFMSRLMTSQRFCKLINCFCVCINDQNFYYLSCIASRIVIALI